MFLTRNGSMSEIVRCVNFISLTLVWVYFKLMDNKEGRGENINTSKTYLTAIKATFKSHTLNS